jgi:tetratricopeptide (TPR) repeat protein
LGFSSDGRRLASAALDNTVKLWDVESGLEVLTLRNPKGSGVLGVAFSPDGSRIAQAAGDNSRRITVWEALPDSDEAKVLREARGLVEFLSEKDQLLSEKDLAADRVRETIRRYPGISESVRQSALALAEHWLPDIDSLQLNNASWDIVRRPDAKPKQYELALNQAETVCKIVKENGDYVNTLGIAQYRMGRYADALATLTKSEKLNAANDGSLSHAADIAFLAMAQYQLGKNDEARVTLGRLREVMKHPNQAKNAEAQGFLREAEKLIEGEPAHRK